MRISSAFTRSTTSHLRHTTTSNLNQSERVLVSLYAFGWFNSDKEEVFDGWGEISEFQYFFQIPVVVPLGIYLFIAPWGLLCRDLSKFSVRLSVCLSVCLCVRLCVCLCVCHSLFCPYLTVFLDYWDIGPLNWAFQKAPRQKPGQEKTWHGPFSDQ